MLTERRTVAMSDWLSFAAVMLLIIGVLNVLEGIITIVYPGRTVMAVDQLYVVNVTAWGILILVFGAILTVVGLGVFWRRTWARVAAIVCVALHAVVQVGWLAAYPLWSLLMLGLDVVLLYALTAHWHDPEILEDVAPSFPRDPHAVSESRILQEHPRLFA